MFDTGNILVGAGTLTIDGAAVGWTRNGVTLSNKPEVFIVEDVDQVVGGVKAVRTNEEITISTELVEATIESVKRAWAINTAIDLATPDHKKLKFGGDPVMPEHEVVFSGIAPNDKLRTVTFWRVVGMDFGDIVNAKGDETTIPVTFRALLDMTRPVGEQIGEFDDEI